MNCTDFDAIVVDLTRGRPMDAALRARAEAHARECDRCRACLSVQRDVAEQLGALRSATRHIAAPAELEDALVAAFRAQSAVASATPAPRPAIPAWWWLGAAAALAIAIGGAAAVMSVSRTKPGITTARTTAPAIDTSPTGRERVPEVGPASPATEAVAQIENEASARKVATRSKPRGRMAPAAPQEAMAARPAYATLPAALPRWSDAPLVPVRLKLPYAALPALGLQTTREQWGETVPVEVLVGEDGIARGIRLVQD